MLAKKSGRARLLVREKAKERGKTYWSIGSRVALLFPSLDMACWRDNFKEVKSTP